MNNNRELAMTRLHDMLSMGDTVYTDLLHVSRSGMSRTIRPTIARDGEVVDLTWEVAQVTGLKIDRDRGGIKMGGCGMDMGFALVYSLSRAMFPNGHKCSSKRDKNGRPICRSNDHTNGDRVYDGRKARHRDGGYALRQSWL